MEKKVQDNAIHDEYYNWPSFIQKKKHFLWPILWVLFSGIFFYQISLKQKILTLIQGKLAENSKCKLHYEGMDLSFFLPKLSFQDLYLPSRCSHDFFPSMTIKEIHAGFQGISFSPFGLKVKLTTILDKVPLEFSLVLGPSGQKILFEQHHYPLKEFNKISRTLQFNGEMDIVGFVLLDAEKGIDSFDWKLESKNFHFDNFALSFSPSTFPPGSPPIQINLGKLDFKTFLAQIEYAQGQQIQFKKFLIGDKSSKIQWDMSGKIAPNWDNFDNSKLALVLKLQFDPEFLSKNSFLNLLLPSDQGQGGKFHFKLEDTLSSPRQMSVY